MHLRESRNGIDSSRTPIDPSRMPTLDRHDRLLSQLQANGRASVAELAEGLGVTSATIRRDLHTLAGEGRLLRTYGGAALADRRPVRDARTIDAKRAIAAAAARLVVDGSRSRSAAARRPSSWPSSRRSPGHRDHERLDVANVLVDRAGVELILSAAPCGPGCTACSAISPSSHRPSSGRRRSSSASARSAPSTA
jgi:hypothetical protein